jgi:hypothetical protein
MNNPKKIIMFFLSIILAIFLVWFGSKFLFLSRDAMNSTQLFLLGLFLATGGIMSIGSQVLGNSWAVSLLFIVSGFYCFGRAAGTIQDPWLARIIGLTCWFAAALVVSITWPSKKDGSPSDSG